MLTRTEAVPPVLTTETVPRVPVPTCATEMVTSALAPAAIVPVSGAAATQAWSARIR